MKKFLYSSAVALLLTSAFVSCKKSSIDDVSVATNGLSSTEKSMIKAAGFDEDWATKQADGKFLIEGDILLSSEQLKEMGGVTPAHELVFATNEHYRTTNLVNTNGGVRTLDITIASSFPAYYSTALTNVINKYNALNLNIRFRKVSAITATSLDIVAADLGGPNAQGGITLGQSQGFPSGGQPAFGFTITTNPNASFAFNTVSKVEVVMQHELGHNIGFRHTDYINRASCGGSSNEGQAGVGAIQIPGTPGTVAGSYLSWMMACNGSNPLAFTTADKTALNYVY
jgi:hypothetical protein